MAGIDATECVEVDGVRIRRIACVARDGRIQVRLPDDLADFHPGREVSAQRREVNHRLWRLLSTALQEGAQGFRRFGCELAIGKNGGHIAINRSPFECHGLVGHGGWRRQHPPAQGRNEPCNNACSPPAHGLPPPESNRQSLPQRHQRAMTAPHYRALTWPRKRAITAHPRRRRPEFVRPRLPGAPREAG